MSEKARKALIKMFKGQTSIQVFAAEVAAVDAANYTIDVNPVDGGPTYYDVRLKPTVDSDDNGIWFLPEVRSIVLVGIIGNNENAAFLLLPTLCKSMLIKAKNGGQVKVESNGNVTLNSGNFGGLIKISDLINRMNKIENDINSLKTVITNWTPVPNDGGAALKAAALTWSGTQLTLTDASMIENTKVKHG